MTENLRNIIAVTFWLICLSCGQSNSGLNGYHFTRAEAPQVSKGPEKQTEIYHRLDTMFTKMASGNNFNGSVIVSKNGEVLFRKSYGYADKENNVPVSDSTMFQLASVSKVITATAVLVLFEKGLIKLDDKFIQYFPDFPYSSITIRNLLTHRSGLPNYIYFLNDMVCSKTCTLSNEEMYSQMVARQPKVYLKPNKAFNYCNTNYALLALLVEKVSGKTFSDFLGEEIFKPLGMRHSGTILSIDPARHAVSKPYDARWKPVETDASDYVVGDKSIYSTPYDLFLFSEALYQNRLLNPETQEMAFSACSREKKLSNYGLGWRMRDFRDSAKKEIYHNGWWHGYRTAFHRRLRDKVTIVVLSNQLNRTAYHTWKIYQALDADTSYSNVAYEE